jgi:hypothetical protein
VRVWAQWAMPMSHTGVAQNWDEPSTPLGAQAVACPKCNTRLAFRRSREPFIDACGFESYAFACHECGASLAGVVDPFDDTLLISELAA